jgi:L-lactate dehydrogenase (cytochrome)
MPDHAMGHLDKAVNIADLRQLAQRRLPRMVFDYIDGGADDEVTLQRSVERFRDYTLSYDTLVDITAIDTSHSVLGAPMRLPFFISPTAASRLFHIAGEPAVARAAHKAGIVYSISTLGSTSIEDIAAVTPGPKLFQIYVWKDRGLVREVLQRVRAAGFHGVVLTVDVPVAGNRERDPRNGFTIPPKVTLQTATQVLARPAWAWDLLRQPPIKPANFAHLPEPPGGIIGFINSQFDRSVTWQDASWLREEWGGPFAIKGIITAADADRAAALGANAVWVSNHGGRQLDTCPTTIDALGPIVAAVGGRAEVILDGGVRRGSDIVKALALGAQAVALGRAYLWGLAAGGQAGVTRALTILEQELTRTMALIGADRIGAISNRFVLPPRSSNFLSYRGYDG